MEKRERWGPRPAVSFMGKGDKAARARTCTAVLVPLQRIFGFGRHPSPLGCGGNRRGRKRVSHTHVHHHWPPREVQEQVTAVGVALGAWRESCRAGGAAGVGGGCCRARGCGGVGRGGRGYGGRLRVWVTFFTLWLYPFPLLQSLELTFWGTLGVSVMDSPCTGTAHIV